MTQTHPHKHKQMFTHRNYNYEIFVINVSELHEYEAIFLILGRVWNL